LLSPKLRCTERPQLDLSEWIGRTINRSWALSAALTQNWRYLYPLIRRVCSTPTFYCGLSGEYQDGNRLAQSFALKSDSCLRTFASSVWTLLLGLGHHQSVKAVVLLPAKFILKHLCPRKLFFVKQSEGDDKFDKSLCAKLYWNL
jgi:hypothetical protein